MFLNLISYAFDYLTSIIDGLTDISEKGIPLSFAPSQNQPKPVQAFESKKKEEIKTEKKNEHENPLERKDKFVRIQRNKETDLAKNKEDKIEKKAEDEKEKKGSSDEKKDSEELKQRESVGENELKIHKQINDINKKMNELNESNELSILTEETEMDKIDLSKIVTANETISHSALSTIHVITENLELQDSSNKSTLQAYTHTYHKKQKEKSPYKDTHQTQDKEQKDHKESKDQKEPKSTKDPKYIKQDPKDKDKQKEKFEDKFKDKEEGHTEGLIAQSMPSTPFESKIESKKFKRYEQMAKFHTLNKPVKRTKKEREAKQLKAFKLLFTNDSFSLLVLFQRVFYIQEELMNILHSFSNLKCDSVLSEARLQSISSQLTGKPMLSLPNANIIELYLMLFVNHIQEVVKSNQFFLSSVNLCLFDINKLYFTHKNFLNHIIGFLKQLCSNEETRAFFLIVETFSPGYQKNTNIANCNLFTLFIFFSYGFR